MFDRIDDIGVVGFESWTVESTRHMSDVAEVAGYYTAFATALAECVDYPVLAAAASVLRTLECFQYCEETLVQG